MADRISRNNQSIIQSIESETRVDLRFRFIDIRIFRCDVIIAYFFTRSAFVVKLDSIGTATVESISRLQGSSMMKIFDKGFQVRILFDCSPKVTLPHHLQVVPLGNKVSFPGLGVGVNLVVGCITVRV